MSKVGSIIAFFMKYLFRLKGLKTRIVSITNNYTDTLLRRQIAPL